MAVSRFRLLGGVLLATGGAGLLGLTTMRHAAFAFGEAINTLSGTASFDYSVLLQPLLGSQSGLVNGVETVGLALLHTIGDLAKAADLANATLLETSDSTRYFLIPQDDLPLLEPLRGIPVIGKPLADLLQPDLKVLVNLGYGADNVGYSTPANTATPIGLFPDVNPATVLNEVVSGAQQGFHDAVSDIMSGGSLSLSDWGTAGALDDAMTPVSLAGMAGTLQNVTQIAYNALFPTADIINTQLTSVPAYDLQLIQDNLFTNPLDAIGLPIAANTGLMTLAGGLEYEVLADAATQVGNELGLIP